MDPLYQQLGIAGALVAVLIGGMRWLSGQYETMRGELREAAKACADRETKLIERIQSLEDSRHCDQQTALLGCTDALKETAGALKVATSLFEKLNEESGAHRAQRT